MDHYHLWFDLRPGEKDTDLAKAITTMLGHLQDESLLHSYSLQRCKLGLRPDALPEWHVDIAVEDLDQLQDAFDRITPRSGRMEKLHAAVWSKVQGLKTALYRDFPDANRTK